MVTFLNTYNTNVIVADTFMSMLPLVSLESVRPHPSIYYSFTHLPSL